MQLIPQGNRILVLQFVEERGAGSLIIPEDAKESLKIAKGKVVHCGEGKESRIIDIEVGDIIHFNKFSGERIMGDMGIQYLILKDEDVLALER